MSTECITLGSKQLAALLGLSHRTFLRLVHRANLPHTIQGNRFVFTMDEHHPLTKSLALARPGLALAFSVAQLARKTGRSKESVRALLRRKSIPIMRNGRKWLVLLSDLAKLA